MRAPLFNASLEAMECGGTLACVIQERNKLKAQVSHTACICVRLLCAVCMCALLCVPLCVPPPSSSSSSSSHPVSPLCSRYAAPPPSSNMAGHLTSLHASARTARADGA